MLFPLYIKFFLKFFIAPVVIIKVYFQVIVHHLQPFYILFNIINTFFLSNLTIASCLNAPISCYP